MINVIVSSGAWLPEYAFIITLRAVENSCYYSYQRLTCKRGERVNFALCWPVRLVCMPFETKEYLTAGATVITAIWVFFKALYEGRLSFLNNIRKIYLTWCLLSWGIWGFQAAFYTVWSVIIMSIVASKYFVGTDEVKSIWYLFLHKN